MAKNTGMGYRIGENGRARTDNPLYFLVPCAACGKMKPNNEWCDCPDGERARLRYEAWVREMSRPPQWGAEKPQED